MVRHYRVSYAGTGTKTDMYRPKYFCTDAQGQGNVRLLRVDWGIVTALEHQWLVVWAELTEAQHQQLLAFADAYDVTEEPV